MLNIITNLKEEQKKFHQLILGLIVTEQVMANEVTHIANHPCPLFRYQVEEIFRCTCRWHS
jgi:hypothetical protein